MTNSEEHLIDLVCSNCQNPETGYTDGDKAMKRQGYQSCGAARNAVERARYIRGSTECVYPERFKQKGFMNDQINV